MTTEHRYGEREDTLIRVAGIERRRQQQRSSIPFDTKHYRAPSHNLFGTSGYSVIAIVLFVMLLGWMGGRDREAHVQRVQEVADSQCR